MHEHKDCKHELKYCKVCDTAYCPKCGREWGKTVYVPTYYYINQYGSTWTYPAANVSYTITAGSTCYTSATNTFHVHD